MGYESLSDDVFGARIPFTGRITSNAEVPSVTSVPVTYGVGVSTKGAIAATFLAVSIVFGAGDTGMSRDLVRPEAIVNGAQHEMGWRTVLARRLDELLAMPAGWEPGAPPISRRAADVLWWIVDQAAPFEIPEPAVVPTIEGGVQAEWHENGIDLEVFGTPEGQVFAYYFAGDKELEMLVSKPRQVRHLLRKLVA